MERAEKLSITLPASLARLVREQVEAGTYASNSEVIREALRAWQQRLDEGALASIRRQIDAAINDPRPRRTPEQVRDRLDRLHRESMKARRRAG
jgi:antitoxin ParD1/3/4